MKTVIHHAVAHSLYPELPALMTTEQAAHYLGKAAQTLRRWACCDSAPHGIRPLRINRRLMWRVKDLQR